MAGPTIAPRASCSGLNCAPRRGPNILTKEKGTLWPKACHPRHHRSPSPKGPREILRGIAFGHEKRAGTARRGIYLSAGTVHMWALLKKGTEMEKNRHLPIGHVGRDLEKTAGPRRRSSDAAENLSGRPADLAKLLLQRRKYRRTRSAFVFRISPTRDWACRRQGRLEPPSPESPPIVGTAAQRGDRHRDRAGSGSCLALRLAQGRGVAVCGSRLRDEDKFPRAGAAAGRAPNHPGGQRSCSKQPHRALTDRLAARRGQIVAHAVLLLGNATTPKADPQFVVSCQSQNPDTRLSLFLLQCGASRDRRGRALGGLARGAQPRSSDVRLSTSFTGFAQEPPNRVNRPWDGLPEGGEPRRHGALIW